MACQICDINRSYSCARLSMHTSDLFEIIGNATCARWLDTLSLTFKEVNKKGRNGQKFDACVICACIASIPGF